MVTLLNLLEGSDTTKSTLTTKVSTQIDIETWGPINYCTL